MLATNLNSLASRYRTKAALVADALRYVGAPPEVGAVAGRREGRARERRERSEEEEGEEGRGRRGEGGRLSVQ